MTLLRWKPFNDFIRTDANASRFLEDEYFGEQKIDAPATWSPVTDTIEESDKYLLKMEVPGLTDKDIQVELNGDTLTVKGEKTNSKETKEENYYNIESYSGKFTRSFSLPKAVVADKINAEMKNGILSIVVPKAEEIKPQSIPILVK